MNRTREFKDKYHETLDSMWALFNYGRDREVALEKELDLAKDELIRIKVLADPNSEIGGICDRGLGNITLIE